MERSLAQQKQEAYEQLASKLTRLHSNVSRLTGHVQKVEEADDKAMRLALTFNSM
jgi:hypothetical protein